ncbi:MAG: copper amine oxidase N-terminal domain-containing protein [Armatimonadota bacterium]
MSRRLEWSGVAAFRCAALSVAVAILAGATPALAQIGFGRAKTIKSKGHVLVDLAPIAKFFGAKVKLNKRTKAIAITTSKVKIGMRVGSEKAKLNGKDKKLPVPPQILEGKTMVPLRWTAEAFGAKLDLQDGGIISVCAPAPSKQCMAVRMPK